MARMKAPTADDPTMEIKKIGSAPQAHADPIRTRNLALVCAPQRKETPMNSLAISNPTHRQRTASSSTVNSGETRRCRAAESSIDIYHH